MPVSETILPVLIGADMNCYTLARAFHEAYGVTSQAFGRWPMGDTMYSRIVQCTYIQDIDNRDTLLATVTQFAHQHADKTCIVLGCTDDYASLLMDIRDELPENCVARAVNADHVVDSRHSCHKRYLRKKAANAKRQQPADNGFIGCKVGFDELYRFGV